MNKKFLILPVAVLGLGIVVSCNGNSNVTPTFTTTTKYFYNVTNEEYDKYFELPTNLTHIDTDVAYYYGRLANANFYKANEVKKISYDAVSADAGAVDSVYYASNPNTAGLNQFNMDIINNSSNLDGIEASDISNLRRGMNADAAKAYGSNSYYAGYKKDYIDEENNTISLSLDSSSNVYIDSHYDFKNTAIYDKTKTFTYANESYDTTFFGETSGDKVNIYNKVNGKYYDVAASYYDIYKKEAYDSMDKYNEAMKYNFYLQLLDAVKQTSKSKNDLSSSVETFKSSETEFLEALTGHETIEMLGSGLKNQVAVGDENSIYIYSYGSSNDSNSRLFNFYLDMLKDKGYTALASYIMQDILVPLEQCGVTFIINPTNPIQYLYNGNYGVDVSAYEALTDYSKYFEHFLPVYAGYESVVKLSKIDNNWCVDYQAIKEQKSLLKNEDGLIFEKPVTFAVEYNITDVNYEAKAEHEVVKYDSKEQLDEPYLIKITTESYTDKKGNYPSIITKNSNIYYGPESIGLYDTTKYDSQTETLPEGVHVFRGYVYFGYPTYFEIVDNEGKSQSTKVYVTSKDINTENKTALGETIYLILDQNEQGSEEPILSKFRINNIPRPATQEGESIIAYNSTQYVKMYVKDGKIYRGSEEEIKEGIVSYGIILGAETY